MKNTHLQIIFGFLLLLFACNEKKDNPTLLSTPLTNEVSGQQLPLDSIAQIKVIDGDDSKFSKVQVGKPTIVAIKSNIKEAGIPKLNSVVEPNLVILGKGNFTLPTPIEAIETPILAGIPEVVIPNETSKKDKNSENFSNYGAFQGLFNCSIYCMLQDKKGNLWFGTRGGVTKFDGKSFTNFTDKQGLGNNFVWSIFEDKNQNIWIGTVGGGVTKYDGKNFTTFTEQKGFCDNTVLSILEDKKGNIWFGTYKGVCKYDGNRIEAIERGEKTPTNEQQDLIKKKGKLIKTFTTYSIKEGLVSNTVLCILEDKNGSLWFGQDEHGGVSKFDGKSFANYREKEGLGNISIASILEDKLGNIWFGSYDNGIIKYDGNRIESIERGESKALQDFKIENGKPIKTFTKYTNKEGLLGNTVNKIIEDKNGNIWIATNYGALKFSGNQFEPFKNRSDNRSLKQNKLYSIKSFTEYTVEQGLDENRINCIFEDRNGKIWIGTSDGLSKFNGNLFTNYGENEGLINNKVNSIAEDWDKNLWFGTDYGVSKYDKKSFTNYTVNEGLLDNSVNCIISDSKKNIWFGSFEGITKFDGKYFTHIQQIDDLDLYSINSMLEDSYGNIWFSSLDYLLKYNGSQWVVFKWKSEDIDNTVREIFEDTKGNIWLGCGSGVIKYDGNRIDAIENGKEKYNSDKQDLKTEKGKLIKTFTLFTNKDGLCDNSIKAFNEDNNGNIWIATRSGINIYNHKYFNSLTIKEGLASNTVSNILKDKKDDFWIGTKLGISKLNKNKLYALKNKSEFNNINFSISLFDNYGYSDGFLGMGVLPGQTMLQANDGDIWVTTYGNLGAIHPQNILLDTVAPNIQITSIELFNEKMIWDKISQIKGETVYAKDTTIKLGNGLELHDFELNGLSKWYLLPENLILDYDNNYLTFNFLGISLNQSKNIKYQYILEGQDENWSSISNKNSATYGNLTHGKYVFKVKAMNGGGYWSNEFIFKFIIKPPFWETWLFKLIITFIVIGSIVFYIKKRERNLKERQRELESKIKSATFEINGQKNLIEEKHKEITDSINYAERIQRALLASKKMLDDNLSDYFILFKPKDVVSGDFYWATKLSNNNFVLVNADSTGHGVPGAIMSIVNIASLKEASLQEITSPDLLLNETRRLVIENLKNDGSAEGGKDGMDGSLLSFDFKNNILHCASANNPIWVVRNKELIEIKADRLPIGKHDRDKEPFTLHSLNLQKGDVVYTLTDGFPDQFGGTSGKKFKHKQLQNLLLSIAHEPMETQKQKLNDVFDNWKGNLEQVDDVCLIGVRV